MTLECEDECLKDVAPLCAQRGYVGANIAFGLDVVEGHTQVGAKTQDIVGDLASEWRICRRRHVLRMSGAVGALRQDASSSYTRTRISVGLNPLQGLNR